jgi:integrase/recombinase XerD
MYACGLRIGEAAKVAIGDIDNSKGVLRIIGKGNKERCVPLPEPMLIKLRRLWSTHRNPRWLTPDRSGSGPVSKNALWRTFRLAVRAAGIKRPVNPHGLRHSYATRLLEQGTEARVVQILLGHVNIATTAIYLHLTEPTRASLKATERSVRISRTALSCLLHLKGYGAYRAGASGTLLPRSYLAEYRNAGRQQFGRPRCFSGATRPQPGCQRGAVISQCDPRIAEILEPWLWIARARPCRRRGEFFSKAARQFLLPSRCRRLRASRWRETSPRHAKQRATSSPCQISACA